MKRPVLALLALSFTAAGAHQEAPPERIQPQARVLTKFVQVEWGDVKEIAARVQEELGEEIKVLADPRTNRIFLMGQPDLLEIAEARIQYLDF